MDDKTDISTEENGEMQRPSENLGPIKVFVDDDYVVDHERH